MGKLMKKLKQQWRADLQQQRAGMESFANVEKPKTAMEEERTVFSPDLVEVSKTELENGRIKSYGYLL